MARSTMDLLARGTGGKTCTNTNDLSGCVNAALADSSTYYQLAYSPQNVKWDGSFRAISVKMTRPGVKLEYRRGYFRARYGNFGEQPNEGAAIAASLRGYAAFDGDSNHGGRGSLKIGRHSIPMTVAPADLSFSADGESHKLNAAMVTCVFHSKANSFQFF